MQTHTYSHTRNPIKAQTGNRKNPKRTCKIERKKKPKQKTPSRNFMRQQTFKDAVCIGHLLLAIGPALRSGLFCRETLLEKSNSSFASSYQLEIASGLELGGISASFSSRTLL